MRERERTCAPRNGIYQEDSGHVRISAHASVGRNWRNRYCRSSSTSSSLSQAHSCTGKYSGWATEHARLRGYESRKVTHGADQQKQMSKHTGANPLELLLNFTGWICPSHLSYPFFHMGQIMPRQHFQLIISHGEIEKKLTYFLDGSIQNTTVEESTI